MEGSMVKSGAVWSNLFRWLRPAASAAARGGASAARGAASAAKAAPSALPTSIPIVKDIPYSRMGVLEKHLGRLGRLEGKDLRYQVGRLAPDARKEIARAAKGDLRAVSDEIDRLGRLRKIVSPEEYEAVRARMKSLQDVRRYLDRNMVNYDRTGWGKFKRGLGTAATAGLLGLDATYFGPETYKAMKDGRYGDAALLMGEMGLFHAAPVGRIGARIGGRAGNALSNLARPVERLSEWGERARGVPGWVARHPVLTAELGGTPLGMKTIMGDMLSGAEGGDDASMLSKQIAGKGAKAVDSARLAQGGNEDDILRNKRLRGGL